MSDNLYPTDNDSLRIVFKAMMGDMRFAMPGIIKSFDYDTNLAEVVPAIMRKNRIGDKIEYTELPVIIRVPVVIPHAQQSNMMITLPIRENDECLLVFSDRFLDNFIERGGIGPPEAQGPNNLHTLPRMHHLTDAICIPGLSSLNYVIPDWNNENIEIRDRERRVYTSVGPNGIESTDGDAITNITNGTVKANAPEGADITDGEATWEMRDGRVAIKAPNGYYVDAPNYRIDDHNNTGWVRGTFQADNLLTNAGFNANSHRHSGVESGPSNTGTFV